MIIINNNNNNNNNNNLYLVNSSFESVDENPTDKETSDSNKPYRRFALPPCWRSKQKKICSHSLHKNGS